MSAALSPVFDPGAPPATPDLAQNRFTALRQFEIWACNSRGSTTCTEDDDFDRVYASPADFFPADAPRPVQPALILREFDIPRTNATHLRVLVRNSQCTGGPQFQGEQDNDPFNATDCDTPGPASARFVRIAEVQAFADDSTVVSAGPGGGGGGGGGSGSNPGSSTPAQPGSSTPAQPGSSTPAQPGQVAGVQATLCVVPNLGGKNAASARAALAKAHCRVGRVTTKRSVMKKGVVLSQTPKAGKRVKAGTRINFVLSRGR